MSEFTVPPAFVEHARRFYESGAAPAQPRVAATVILLRPEMFEVYLIRRAATMAFASGMYAFPGGSVDPRDATGDLSWRGPSDADWAGRLAVPPPAARGIVCAAVRELFEESGVLLSDVDSTTEPEWEEARRALVSRELSLSDLLASRGLALRSDLLVPWSRWITPEFEPRRFDTYFFLAVMPEGQDARDVSGEADHTMWIHPADAAGHRMLPPTLVTLRELASYPDGRSALAAAADRDVGTPVMPRLDGDRLVVPGTGGSHADPDGHGPRTPL